MQIIKTVERDMGHRVPNHKSKCRNLHGHRYKAEIELSWPVVRTKGVSEEWMVVDFSDIKTIAKEFVDWEWDHGYMYFNGDEIGFLAKQMGMKAIEVDFIPTAENIVVLLFDELKKRFEVAFWKNVQLWTIRLRETPTSFVEYQGGGKRDF